MRVSQKFLTYMVVGALVAALSISCSNEGTTWGDTGGGETGSHLEYGQFLPAKDSYTANVAGGTSQTTTITIVKNSDGTCNLKGKVALLGTGNYDASTGKYKEVDIDIKVNEWYRTKGETDNATSRSVDNLPSSITYFEARHSSYTSGSTTTYYLVLSINEFPRAFEGKAN